MTERPPRKRRANRSEAEEIRVLAALLHSGFLYTGVFESEIFRNAILGGTMTAALSGVTGYFLALRGQAFASEAFTDIGFSGAAGAALIGISPLLGMASFATLAAAGVGLLSSRARGRDVEIGMILTFALGTSALFLTMYSHSNASRSMSGINMLFGSLLTLRLSDVVLAGGLALGVLAAVLVIFRPLLFATVDPAVAAARGVPTGLMSVAFLVIVAFAVACSARMVGVLLVPSLMIAPSAAAVNLTGRPLRAILLSTGFAEAVVWGGVVFGFSGAFGGLPVGFYMGTIAAILYFGSIALRHARRRNAGPDPK